MVRLCHCGADGPAQDPSDDRTAAIGRGTIARILEACRRRAIWPPPRWQVSAPTLGSRRWSASRCAVVGDVRLAGPNVHTSTRAAALHLGEDLITIDRKYKDQWTKLPTRFLLISNELPRLLDASGAIATRFVVVQLEESSSAERKVPRSEATNRTHRNPELGAGRAGSDHPAPFTVPKASEDAIRDLPGLVSPVRRSSVTLRPRSRQDSQSAGPLRRLAAVLRGQRAPQLRRQASSGVTCVL